MRRSIFILAVLPLLFTSCGLMTIYTVNDGPSRGYTTTVTVPTTHTTTTTVTQIHTYDNDLSLYLDLQGIAAAFAQSSSVSAFEVLLNNSSYMLSNLDLNGDGYVDYLRVIERRQGYNHVFVIQAVLGANIYQDVATIVAEVPSLTRYHVQIIGSPYIYGRNFIIEPVFRGTPLIISHLYRPNYVVWTSPYYWSHYPSHYKYPRPIYLSHYHAYVRTYMSNHRYCREFVYVDSCFYPNYVSVCSPVQRNDYGTQHPERSFTTRTADKATNARVIYDANRAASATTTTNSRTSSGSSSTAASTPSRGSSSSSTATSSTGSRGTSSSTSTATPSRGSSSTSTAASSTGSRGTSSSTSTATPSRGSSSSSTATSSTGSRGTSSASSSAGSRSSSTTVKSRVNNSGSSTTTINDGGRESNRSAGSRSTSSSSASSSSSSSSRSTSGNTGSRSASGSTGASRSSRQ